MVILENIDIDIDKAILQNIDIDKILNRFKFGISNRATRPENIAKIDQTFLMVIIKRTRYKHQKRSWGSPPFQIFRKSWNFAPNGRTPKLKIV